MSRLEKKYRLENLTVGILGMAFKGESDDIRSSLSYKLKRILEFRAGRVITTDPYVTVDEPPAAGGRHRAVRHPHRRRAAPAVPERVRLGRGGRRRNLLGKGTNV